MKKVIKSVMKKIYKLFFFLYLLQILPGIEFQVEGWASSQETWYMQTTKSQNNMFTQSDQRFHYLLS